MENHSKTEGGEAEVLKGPEFQFDLLRNELLVGASSANTL